MERTKKKDFRSRHEQSSGIKDLEKSFLSKLNKLTDIKTYFLFIKNLKKCYSLPL